MPRQIAVRMGEIAVSANPADQLVALGLGSCIGICLMDPIAKVGALGHVVLPDSSMARKDELPGKYADTAIPEMLKQLNEFGGLKSRIRAAVAGGAHVFNFGASTDSKLDIGARNSAAVLNHLEKLRIPIVAEDCGGSVGRTVQLYIESGLVTIRTAGEKEQELANLTERGFRIIDNAA